MSEPRTRKQLDQEILRLSVALSAPANLSPYERRELEGAIHALSWAAGWMRSAPVDWMLAPAVVRLVDQLAAGRLLEQTDQLIRRRRVEQDDPPRLPGFLELSQPREREQLARTGAESLR
jgi:hypothetical protein